MPLTEDYTLSTPVCVVIYKRTEPVKRLLDVLRQVEPPEMLIVGDGWDDGDEAERRKVERARSFVEGAIDWDCTLRTNYADRNMGGPLRYPTGLDWVFNTVEEAIIFEEDHLPSPDFFPYCESLLERYRDDETVMGICGNNAGISPDVDASYFFTPHHRTIGWATWSSAWDKYDREMEQWPEMKADRTIYERCATPEFAAAYEELLDEMFNQDYETRATDAVWQYSIFLHGGQLILPVKNLVKHTGYGSESMHNEVSPYVRQFLLPDLERLDFPLDHPSTTEDNIEFERGYYAHKRGKTAWLAKMIDHAIHVLRYEGIRPLFRKSAKQLSLLFGRA